MIVIGERINGMFKKVGAAIVAQDEAAIVELAHKQLEAGATILDLNVGPTAEDSVAAMAWLVSGALIVPSVRAHSIAAS